MRIQEDEALRARVENYFQQRNFQIQQQQNAQIGRQGAQPTQFGATGAAQGAPAQATGQEGY